MIRKVKPEDIPAITDIYNFYITHSTATFEVSPLATTDMQKRVLSVSSHYPYLVEETDGKITGYCYAHAWKERAAYSQTWETTIYVAPDEHQKGTGTRLMKKLIEECRKSDCHVLIACITEGNKGSCILHEKLGFTQVSHFKEVGYKFGRRLGIADYQLMLE